VCSTTASRIARICGAIEELAGRSCEPDVVTVTAAQSGRSAAGDDLADRLAAIWVMIADVDPELARRMPGYLAAAD
jgi:hypothetical protein